MTIDYNPSGTGDLDAIRSDGVAFARDPLTQLISFGVGTFFVELGSDDSPAIAMTSLLSTHFAWSAAFAAAITVEACNFPRANQRGGATGAAIGPGTVSSFDATAGNWIPMASTTNTDVTGVGNTSSGLTVTAGGTNAGGCMYDVGNAGPRRIRHKLVVTVAGTCRINRRAKNAA